MGHTDPMAVPARKVIQLLRGAIEEAAPPAYQPSDFDGWKERARTALRLAFGEGDQVIARFDDIRYGLSMWSTSTPASAWGQRPGGAASRRA